MYLQEGMLSLWMVVVTALVVISVFESKKDLKLCSWVAKG